MSVNELDKLIKDIVVLATELKNKFTHEVSAPVNYACIFAQKQEEYEDLIRAAARLGTVIMEMTTGLLFELAGIETMSGTLKLLKIRQPYPTRPERGDADFTVADFSGFKQIYLSKPGFKLIARPQLKMEMIELMQPGYEVRVYFSNPPLAKALGLE